MNIRVDLNNPIFDGSEVIFRSPVDCSQVTGLIVYYPNGNSVTSREFVFADAHGRDVGTINTLFAADAVVKVILDTDTNPPKAFVQNADTNTYLENRFKAIEDSIKNGGGGGGSVELDTTLTQAGKAADAKAVGDKIGNIDAALDAIIAMQNQLLGGGDA